MFRFARDSWGVSRACDAVYPLTERTAHGGLAMRCVVLVALTAVGCDRLAGSSPAPRPAPPPIVAPGLGPSLPPPAPLEISNRPVTLALRDVAAAAHTAVVIDPDASAVAACARISVYAPAATDPTALVTLVAAALEPQGLRLDRQPSGLVLRRVADAPLPASCTRTPLLFADDRTRELVAGIRRVSDTEVLVTRSAVDALFTDASLLMRQARIVPHVRDGRPDGLKLYAIRPSSVAAALGLQNGDTVRTVDGRDVSSPDHALEAYTALRSATRVVIELERRGAPVRVLYRVVPRLPAR